jgi:hypothetical protein
MFRSVETVEILSAWKVPSTDFWEGEPSDGARPVPAVLRAWLAGKDISLCTKAEPVRPASTAAA